MKKVFNLVLILGLITSLLFLGCRKKETIEVDNETQSSIDNAVADQEYMAIVPTVNNHSINSKGTGNNKMMVAVCDTLTWLNRTTADTNLTTGNKYIKAPIYELNLQSSCSNSFTDGKLRSGKWTVRITGPLKLAGSQMILKLVNHNAGNINYACDSMVVTTISSTTLSTVYNVKLINGVCSNPNWVIKYSFDRTFSAYPKGNPINTDPVIEVYGTANGVNRTGKSFTVNIPQASPLIKHKACQFIDKGVLQLTPEGFKTRTVDFGNGDCDDNATFTVNGSTVAFKLK